MVQYNPVHINSLVEKGPIVLAIERKTLGKKKANTF
jgi:hypothetical protein